MQSLSSPQATEESHPHLTPQVDGLAFRLGGTIVAFAFFAYTLDCLTLIAGGTIAAWQLLLALVLSLAYCLYIPCLPSSQSQTRTVWMSISLFGTLLLITPLISLQFYDLSWDGQNYHQEAVLHLSRGWNPFYHRLTEPESVHRLWINNYAKTAWYIATNLYQLTQRLEAAKAFNLLLMVASGTFVAAVLQHRTSIKLKWIVAIAVLFALNPVVISQNLTFYLDGQIASLLLCLGCVLYLISTSDRLETALLLQLFFSVCLLVNLKFTSLVYAIVFLFGALVWLLIKNRRLAFKLGIASGLSLTIGILGFAYHPYVTNFIYGKHPFYPLAGVKKVEIITQQIPQDLVGQSSVVKFARSLFVETDFKRNTVTRLKFPFVVHFREIRAMAQEARVGAFGPLFGTAIILSVVILGLHLRSQFQLFSIALIGTLLASVLINPESWWARYVPQAWLLAPMAIVSGLQLKTKVGKFLGYALMIVLCINCALAIAPDLAVNLRGSWIVAQQLHKIPRSTENPVVVFFNAFTGNQTRFIEHNIPWVEVKSAAALPCAKPQSFYSSKIQFCPGSSATTP